MSTIKNRVHVALAGKPQTCAQIAATTGLTVEQVLESIKNLRESGDVRAVRSCRPALYGVISEAPDLPAPNVSMVQHARSCSPISVFHLGDFA